MMRACRSRSACACRDMASCSAGGICTSRISTDCTVMPQDVVFSSRMRCNSRLLLRQELHQSRADGRSAVLNQTRDPNIAIGGCAPGVGIEDNVLSIRQPFRACRPLELRADRPRLSAGGGDHEQAALQPMEPAKSTCPVSDRL